MQHSSKLFASFSLSVLLAACAEFGTSSQDGTTLGRLENTLFLPYTHQVVPTDMIGEVHYRTSPVVEKNYAVGYQNVAFVGQPLVKIKARENHAYRKLNKVKVTHDVVMRGGAADVKVYKDRVYDIIGSMTVRGDVLDILQVSPREGLLIRQDGTFSGDVVRIEFGRSHLIAYTFVQKPAEARVYDAGDVREVTSPNSVNFEIIYSGLRDGRFYVTYIDHMPATAGTFSKDGRVSGYHQTFAYDAGTTVFHINGMDIRVIAAHPEKLHYVILNDPPFLAMFNPGAPGR